MSEIAKRYLVALLIGWAVGGVFLVFLHVTGLNSEWWSPLAAFALTFTVTTFAIGILP